jgi:hypothetical protein
MTRAPQPLAALPSVDRLLQQPVAAPLITQHGRSGVTGAIRTVLAELRAGKKIIPQDQILEQVAAHLARGARPSLRPVFNLTGTVLHTNLGRAQLPEEAVEAMAQHGQPRVRPRRRQARRTRRARRRPDLPPYRRRGGDRRQQ